MTKTKKPVHETILILWAVNHEAPLFNSKDLIYIQLKNTELEFAAFKSLSLGVINSKIRLHTDSWLYIIGPELDFATCW